MIFGEGFVGVALLILWIYCVFDVIATDASLVQHLPKMIWLLIVLFLPDIGSVAWLVLGRPRGAGLQPGSTAMPRRQHLGRAVSAPELTVTDPDEYERRREEALRRYQAEKALEQQKRDAEAEAKRLQAWEEELRRREKELGPE